MHTGVEWANSPEVNEVSVSLTRKAVMMPLRAMDPRQEFNPYRSIELEHVSVSFL